MTSSHPIPNPPSSQPASTSIAAALPLRSPVRITPTSRPTSTYASYVLVSSSSPSTVSSSFPLSHRAQNQDTTVVHDLSSSAPSNPPPRFQLLLPIIALIDASASILLGSLIIRHETSSEPDSHQRIRLALSVMGCAMLRSSTFAVVGFSKTIRDMGILVAAICLLSSLFLVSVANLLFQARGTLSPPPSPLHQVAPTYHQRRPLHPEPTFPILIGSQLAFTLLEWVSYIAVVGVKVPPGGNPIKARRWHRSLKDAAHLNNARSVDVRSIYDTEEDDEEDDDEDDDMGQSRAVAANTMEEYESDQRTEEVGSRRGKEVSERTPLQQQQSSPRPKSFGYGTLDSSGSAGGGAAAEVGRSFRSPTTPSRRSLRSQLSKLDVVGGSSSGDPNKSPRSARPVASTLSSIGFPTRSGGMETGEEEGEDEGEDDDDLDPNDIIDITSDRTISRQASRRRLALANHPARRTSGVSVKSGWRASAAGLEGGGSVAATGGGGVGLWRALSRSPPSQTTRSPKSSIASLPPWLAAREQPSGSSRVGIADGGGIRPTLSPTDTMTRSKSHNAIV
ncbi:hypothetical protein IE53DRAFT_387085 [Violaceomyces palustris]|uniref:Uncharacterized protein n=1 Tax=Violaceomyces palustris TaxID=1673888 RepID=A0ACD0NXY4_9BASI|nr:hypothetical protein IE53DRAFT_387085 [Violaceomyces palustris]